MDNSNAAARCGTLGRPLEQGLRMAVADHKYMIVWARKLIERRASSQSRMGQIEVEIRREAACFILSGFPESRSIASVGALCPHRNFVSPEFSATVGTLSVTSLRTGAHSRSVGEDWRGTRFPGVCTRDAYCVSVLPGRPMGERDTRVTNAGQVLIQLPTGIILFGSESSPGFEFRELITIKKPALYHMARRETWEMSGRYLNGRMTADGTIQQPSL
jgi:hypothetical protein